MGSPVTQYPGLLTEDIEILNDICRGASGPGIPRQIGKSLIDAEEAEALGRLIDIDVDGDAIYSALESRAQYYRTEEFAKVLNQAEVCLKLMLKNGMQVDLDRSYVQVPVEG